MQVVLGRFGNCFLTFVSCEVASSIDIPVKYLDADGKPTVVIEPWPILDIHDTLHFLMDEAEINIPEDRLRHFWQTSKDNGEIWAQEVQPHEMDTLVPIGLYGDSARVDTRHGHENVLGLFLNLVLWRPQAVRWSRFLIFAIAEERLTSATIPTILRRMTWSANHAFFGRFPTEGHLGQNLSGAALKKAGQAWTSRSLKFQVTELRGDWSYHKKIFRFGNNTHWNGEYVCHLCNAKGISDFWPELYWNIEENNHMTFTLAQFLGERMPARNI